jgi:hypothetical protein
VRRCRSLIRFGFKLFSVVARLWRKTNPSHMVPGNPAPALRLGPIVINIRELAGAMKVAQLYQWTTRMHESLT